MSMESDYFKRSRPDTAGLEDFGFRREGDGFVYCEELMEHSFRAEVRTNGSGGISTVEEDIAQWI